MPGYDTSFVTHGAVAQEVAQGAADVALGIRSAAENAGLDFIPLVRERFDLVIPVGSVNSVNVGAFVDELETRRARKMIGNLSGYDVSHTGDEVLIAG